MLENRFYIYIDKCRQRHLHQENLDLNPTSQSINNPVVYTEIEELRVKDIKHLPYVSGNGKPWGINNFISRNWFRQSKLRTSNHSPNGSRQSLSSCCSVQKDEQQRDSGDNKKYFQLEQQ